MPAAAPPAAETQAAAPGRTGVVVALCGCGALLGYGYGLARRQNAALALSGKRAIGLSTENWLKIVSKVYPLLLQKTKTNLSD